jgi:methyl coenzyme M reductase beta subunit
MSKVVKRNRVEIYNERGELVEERDATLEDVAELLSKYVDMKIQDLVTKYDIEVTIDPTTFKGVGRWRKKQ